MAQPQHNFQELEESSEALNDFILGSKADHTISQMRDDTQAYIERCMETKMTANEILTAFGQTEEKVSQDLLDLQERRSLWEQEMGRLEEQIQKYTASNHTLDAEHQFLKGELESLRNSEQELVSLQQEVDEDTTEIIPSAIHLAQLYHTATKIKWEYNTEPHILKGVHYGPDLATPINIDTTVTSRCHISDQLWALVSTEW